MANQKISELDPGSTPLSGNELVEIVQGGSNRRVTTQDVADLGGGGGTWGSITGTLSSQTDLQTALNAKQESLVSGTNIKTINSTTLLGSGDVVISELTPYDVKSYGAVGDGVANDTTAINDTITAAPAGSAIYFPPGTYLINAVIDVTKKLRLFGLGATITSATNQTMIEINADEVEISGINITGTLANTTQIGVNVDDQYKFKIRGCTFTNVGLYGARVQNTIDTYQSGNFFDCNFVTCSHGIFSDSRGEYFSVIGGAFIGCTGRALWINSGNVIVSGVNIVQNAYGLYMSSGTNNAHGIVVGCNINHNTVSIFIESTILGQTFGDCHIYQGGIHLKNCNNITFDHCQLDVDYYRFESAFNCMIQNSSLYASYSNTVSPNYNNTLSSVRWENNIGKDQSTNIRYDRGGRNRRQAQSGTTLDFGLAEIQYRTLIGDVTITDITNPILGKKIRLEIIPGGFTYTLIDNAQLTGTWSTSEENIIELTCIDDGYIPRFIGVITQAENLVPPRSTDITWYNPTTFGSISGSTFSKSGGTSTTFDTSAETDRCLNGDGTLQCTPAIGNTNAIIGLTTGNPQSSATYTSMNFALYVASGSVFKSELGVVSSSIGTFASGNLLRINIVGTTVTYEKSTDGGSNWTVLNTSGTSATFPLNVDVSIRGSGDSFASCKLTGTIINRRLNFNGY